jgi:hypothetical protein
LIEVREVAVAKVAALDKEIRRFVATVHDGAWRRAGNSPCIPLHDR